MMGLMSLILSDIFFYIFMNRLLILQFLYLILRAGNITCKHVRYNVIWFARFIYKIDTSNQRPIFSFIILKHCAHVIGVE